jgi:uncharacterized RDD family membrane protein YckC
MDKHFGASSPSKKPTWLNSQNLQDIEVDFKPLSEGLGFHHSEPVKTIKLPAKQEVNPFQKPSLKEQHQPEFYKNDLSQFYAKAVSQEKVKQTENLEKPVLSATNQERAIAWVMDQVFIVALVSLTFFSVEWITSLGLLDALKVYSVEAWTAFGLMWLSYQLFYFTFSERFFAKTIGKEMMGIKIHTTLKMDLMTTFIRGLIKVLSILSLGVLAFYDVQSKATDTRVVKAA